MTSPLRAGLLDGRRVVQIAVADDAAISRHLDALGAARRRPPDRVIDNEETAAAWARAQAPVHALVCDAAPAFAADGLQPALELAWRAARAVATGALIDAGEPRLLFLAPEPAAGGHAEAVGAGLENLARTLSVEWARFAITTATICPGRLPAEDEVAQLVCFLVSTAGAHFSGCPLRAHMSFLGGSHPPATRAAESWCHEQRRRNPHPERTPGPRANHPQPRDRYLRCPLPGGVGGHRRARRHRSRPCSVPHDLDERGRGLSDLARHRLRRHVRLRRLHADDRQLGLDRVNRVHRVHRVNRVNRQLQLGLDRRLQRRREQLNRRHRLIQRAGRRQLRPVVSSRRFTVHARPWRSEHRQAFDCFGGRCTVSVSDAAAPADAAAAAAMAEHALRVWHARFSRFEAHSELSRLNQDARERVPASPLMRRMVQVALDGARATGGLVDCTLGREIERAGYVGHFEGDGVPLAAALAMAPPRAPASPHPDERWRRVSVDADAGTVNRPPGLQIDLGGIAKGVFADELAGMLDGFDAYAVDCAGDVRVGGRGQLPRPVEVLAPFHDGVLQTVAVTAGAVATSGIGRRSWLTGGGRPAHHLLDPGTGAPAYTGIVQATALAPTAAEAEILAKAAILSGAERAAEWLSHGGILVVDDGSYRWLGAAGENGEATARADNQLQMSSSTASRSGSLRISWNRPS